jgi:hypothetical protein
MIWQVDLPDIQKGKLLLERRRYRKGCPLLTSSCYLMLDESDLGT